MRRSPCVVHYVHLEALDREIFSALTDHAFKAAADDLDARILDVLDGAGGAMNASAKHSPGWRPPGRSSGRGDI
jgi:hypothetical protein